MYRCYSHGPNLDCTHVHMYARVTQPAAWVAPRYLKIDYHGLPAASLLETPTDPPSCNQWRSELWTWLKLFISNRVEAESIVFSASGEASLPAEENHRGSRLRRSCWRLAWRTRFARTNTPPTYQEFFWYTGYSMCVQWPTQEPQETVSVRVFAERTRIYLSIFFASLLHRLAIVQGLLHLIWIFFVKLCAVNELRSFETLAIWATSDHNN